MFATILYSRRFFSQLQIKTIPVLSINSREVIPALLSKPVLRVIIVFQWTSREEASVCHDLEHAFLYLQDITWAGVVLRARIQPAWTSKASREKGTLGSGNNGVNSAITEARRPRGFGIRLGRPLLAFMVDCLFWIDGNVDLDECAAALVDWNNCFLITLLMSEFEIVLKCLEYYARLYPWIVEVVIAFWSWILFYLEYGCLV